MPTLEEQLQTLATQLTDTTPASLPALPRQSADDGGGGGWTGLLGDVGEVLSGGQSPTYRLRGSERAAAGSRALLNFGINMLMASGPQRVRPDLGSIFGAGLQGAQQSMDLDQRRAAAVAQQDYTQRLELAKLGVEQSRDKIERAKAALELLRLQNRPIINPDGSVTTAGGGGSGTTSASAPGAIQFTGDKEKDRALIIQRESGGKADALNYVAQADPEARARGATASGLYGFVDSTWKEGLQMIGGDVSKYPTAQSAPAEVQHKVFDAIYDKRGTAPWDPSKWGQQWVKGADGKYTLVKGGTTATAAAPPSPKVVPSATSPAAPAGVQMGGPPPAPPGASPGGATTAYTGGGIGSVLNPPAAALPVPPPIPKEGLPVGSAGLRQMPDGTIVQPGGGFPRRTAAADAIMEGVQTAQATPLVRGTGQEAGPSSAVAQTRPSPDQGFGSAVGSYGGPPGTAPAPPPAPAVTAPAPAVTPPAPAVTPPAPVPAVMSKLPKFEDFFQQNLAKPTPQEEALFHTPLSEQEERERLDNLKRLQSSVEAARLSFNAPGSKDTEGAYQNAQKAYTEAQKDLSKARRDALDVGDKRKAEWLAKEKERIQGLYGKLQEAEIASDKSRTDHTQALELEDVKHRNKVVETEEASLQEIKRKTLEPIAAKAENAHAMLKDAQTLELFARQMGEGNALWDTDFGRSLNGWIASYGGSGSDTVKQAAARQSWDAIVGGLFNDVHVPGMGSQSDKEGAFLMSQWGNKAQSPLDRMTQLAIIKKTAEARIADHTDALQLAENKQPISGINKIRQDRQVFDRPPTERDERGNLRAPADADTWQRVNRYNATHGMGEPYVTWAPTPSGKGKLVWARNTGDPAKPVDIMPNVDVTR